MPYASSAFGFDGRLVFHMELIITNRKGEKFTMLYDECDHHIVIAHKWHMASGYAVTDVRSAKSKTGFRSRAFHAFILDLSDPKMCRDHINRVRLDNRRCNLRVCTRKQNAINSTAWGKVKYKGVYTKGDKRVKAVYIQARIMVNARANSLGYFKTEEDAARAYDAAAKIHFGEFANLNFPDHDL